MENNEARKRAAQVGPMHALIAAVVLGLVVLPIAFAGAANDPQAPAKASVKKQVKKLKKQVKQLQRQIDELARQPGPQGPQGIEGEQGPPGPSTGPAGGDLTGNYPNPLIGPNAVGSSEIADEAVGFDDIARNAVGVSQIVDENVTSDKIAANAVTESEIAADAVNNSELGFAAVSSAEIANGNVLSADLGGGAVEAANLGPAFAVAGTGVLVLAGTSQEATVTCPGNSRLLSGGFEWLNDDDDASSIMSSSPSFVGDPNKTWVVSGRRAAGAGSNTLFAEALCLAV
jgi:hypothetical protein